MSVWYQEKQSNLKIQLKFFWNVFVIYSCKTGKCWIKIYKILSNFVSNPLICDPTLFLGKNSPNIAKSNCVFPGKGRGDRALILTYLNSPMAKVFLHFCLIFLDFDHLQGKKGGQSWTKSANFGFVSFLWKLKFFKFISNNHWWEFWQY